MISIYSESLCVKRCKKACVEDFAVKGSLGRELFVKGFVKCSYPFHKPYEGLPYPFLTAVLRVPSLFI